MTPDQQFRNGGESEDRPPFFSSWPKVYTFVLSFLSFLILLFYLFMKVYS